MEIIKKEHIRKTAFTSGLIIDPGNMAYRTNYINTLFEICNRLPRECEGINIKADDITNKKIKEGDIIVEFDALIYLVRPDLKNKTRIIHPNTKRYKLP